jgi:hypothetical protein
MPPIQYATATETVMAMVTRMTVARALEKSFCILTKDFGFIFFTHIYFIENFYNVVFLDGLPATWPRARDLMN